MGATNTVRERIADIMVESVYDNPIAVKELRTRMRGRKAFVTMGGYALLLSGVMFIAYMIITAQQTSVANSRMGQQLFSVLIWTQMGLITLMVPSLTSGAFTQEISQKTMEMLALTRLTAGNIVVGKLLSGFLYALILMACSVPLAGMSFMFGGISPAEVAVTYLLLISYAFLFNAFGVFASSLFERHANATGFTQMMCIGFAIGTMMLGAYGLEPVLWGYGTSTNPYSLSLLNPGWASYGALLVSDVAGVKVPIAAAAFVLEVAAGFLMLLVASTHVRFHKVERALPIRVLLLAITAVGVWLAVGGIPGTMISHLPAGSKIAFLAPVSSIILACACFLAASFATGELKNGGRSMLRYAFSLRKAFRGDIGGAIPFMVIWIAVAYGAFGVTMALLMRSAPASLPGFWPNYFAIGAAMTAIVIAVSSVGIFTSSVVTTRNNAGAGVIVFAVLIFLVYTFILNYYLAVVLWNNKSNSPIWQLAALWPMTPIMAHTGGWGQDMPKLWWPVRYSWMVTSIAYLFLTLLILPSARNKKTGGVRED